jgi:hypothetical protein
MPAECWLETLREVEKALVRRSQSLITKLNPPISQLVSYYQLVRDLARGYEKDPAKLEEHLQIVQGEVG